MSTQVKHCHKAFFQNEEPAIHGRWNNEQNLRRYDRKCHLLSSCRDLETLAPAHHLFERGIRMEEEIEWKKFGEILARDQTHPIACPPTSSSFGRLHQYFPW